MFFERLNSAYGPLILYEKHHQTPIKIRIAGRSTGVCLLSNVSLDGG